MANDTPLTIVGNLVEDPILRFTGQGAAVANLTIASTPRTFDKNANEWKDGETLFMRCSIWREAAENVAESLKKGQRVIASGRLVQRNWEQDGQKRSGVELQLEEIGPSLKYATAQVAKAERQSGQRSSGGFGGAAQSGGQPQSDPWSTGVPAGSAPRGGNDLPFYDEPPF